MASIVIKNTCVCCDKIIKLHSTSRQREHLNKRYWLPEDTKHERPYCFYCYNHVAGIVGAPRAALTPVDVRTRQWMAATILASLLQLDPDPNTVLEQELEDYLQMALRVAAKV